MSILVQRAVMATLLGFVDGAYWDLIISGVSVSDSNPDTPADMGASAANRTLVGENILKQNVWNFIAMTF